jgi:hypothetical protein
MLLSQTQPQGLHDGHHCEILNRDHGGFSPTITPLNPTEVRIVTYEYLLYAPLSDRLRLPGQRKAQGLLLGSSTPGTVGR